MIDAVCYRGDYCGVSFHAAVSAANDRGHLSRQTRQTIVGRSIAICVRDDATSREIGCTRCTMGLHRDRCDSRRCIARDAANVLRRSSIGDVRERARRESHIWRANTSGGKTNRSYPAGPLCVRSSPRPLSSATAERATMAGLMKDVGASYGCHNSARTGRYVSQIGRTTPPRTRLAPPPYMTSDSRPTGGSGMKERR